MIASTATDVLFGIMGFHLALTIAIVVLVGRLMDKIARIQEWIRLYERKNGHNGRSGQ